MTMKKKIVATTAFLLILAFITPVFWINKNASPLDKTIIVHFQYADGTAIGECLYVTLDNQGESWISHTDSEGKAVFPGLADETYTWKWYWQAVYYKHSEEIDCSQIVWEFTETVNYWIVAKTFYYAETEIPVVGLEVHFNGLIGYTDETGTVVFSDIKAGNYTLEWVWGGETKTELVEIAFQTESLIWKINYLEPKSGGGK